MLIFILFSYFIFHPVEMIYYPDINLLINNDLIFANVEIRTNQVNCGSKENSILVIRKLFGHKLNPCINYQYVK